MTRLTATLLLGLLAACGMDPANAPSDAFARYAQSATEQQRPFFEDGAIDFFDYRRAVLATEECLHRRGYRASADIADDGLYQYTVQAHPDPSAVPMGRALEECRDMSSAAVERAFWVSRPNAPQPQP